MRHRVAHRKLGRVTEHRIALLRNQAQELFRHERIKTTLAKAKELRPFAERLITVAKRGTAEGNEGVRALNARRLVARDLGDRAVVRKLFDTIAPRFADRPGGYTRILRVGHRQGDAVEVAQLELVGSEYSPDVDTATQSETGESSGDQGVGSRLRRVAKRIRGQASESDASDAESK